MYFSVINCILKSKSVWDNVFCVCVWLSKWDLGGWRLGLLPYIEMRDARLKMNCHIVHEPIQLKHFPQVGILRWRRDSDSCEGVDGCALVRVGWGVGAAPFLGALMVSPVFRECLCPLSGQRPSQCGSQLSRWCSREQSLKSLRGDSSAPGAVWIRT